jgi:anti-anti-sigma factor
MPDSLLPSRPPASRSSVAVVAPASDAFSSTRRAESGGSIRLILAGELDLAARPQLITALDAAQADSDRVVLDLAALLLIDCSCLFVVFVAADRSARERAVLILFRPLGQVRRVLDLVGAPAGVVILDRDEVPYDGSVGAAA